MTQRGVRLLELRGRLTLHGRELVDELTVLLVLLAPDGGPSGAEDLPERDADHDSQDGDPGDGNGRNGPVDVVGGCRSVIASSTKRSG